MSAMACRRGVTKRSSCAPCNRKRMSHAYSSQWTATTVAYQQILSMAIEDRSSSYQDLVSDNNALLAVMRDKGLWQTYSGPRIRQTLQIAKQTAQWYNGYDVLLNPAIDLFADAWYEPKMVVVPIILSNQEILNNQGEAQLMDSHGQSTWTPRSAHLEDAMDAAHPC